MRNICLAAGLVCATASAPLFSAETAQVFPARPVRLVVPFSPGGGTDITARALAQKLTESWGQQVIVDNRPGASGNIGAELVARAAPDGYTLLAITATHAVNAALQPKMPYDLLGDLAPISLVTSLPYVMVVHPSVAAKSVKEFVALSISRPEGLTYGSSGIGSLGHLSGALLSHLSSAKLLYVPYRGGAAAVADVMGGQINMTFTTALQSAPHVRSGKLRALAVTTLKRSTVLPEVPAMTEAGVPGYEVNQWNGILGPRALPRSLVAKLSSDVNAALHTPEVQGRLASDGSDAVGTTPEAFAASLRAEVGKWKSVIASANIKPE